MRLSVLLLFLILFSTLNAQVVLFDGDEEVYVQEGVAETVVAKFLAQEGGEEVVFNTDVATKHTYPLKMRTQKGWFLYTSEIFSKDMASGKVNTTPYDSVGFPVQLAALNNYGDGSYYGFAARHEGLYHLFCVPYGEQAKHAKFTYTALLQQAQLSDVGDPLFHVLSKKDGLWGVEYGDLLMQPHLFEQPQQVPFTYYDEYEYNKTADLRKKHGVDLVLPVGDVHVKARDKKTRKWGVFFGEGSYEELVPTAYDKVRYHTEAQLVEFWDGDAVGCFMDEERNTQPMYKDLKIVSLDWQYGMALKSDQGWIILDQENFKPIVDGYHPTIEAVLEQWLNR